MKILITIFAIIFALTGCGNNVPQNTEQQQAIATGTGHNNTKICWGFRKIKNAAPEVPADIKELLKRYDSFYVGDETKKELYLTFDEGYENGYTSQILDTLKKTKTPAAFFVTGQYIKEHPDLVKRMTDEGHIVGNHSVKHPSFPEVDDARLTDEICNLNAMYNELTGKNMSYLRPPKGEFSERTLALSHKLGYKNIFWSSAYVDWDTTKLYGAKNAVEKVVSQLHNGNIILLHAVSKDNADGLEEIINVAKKQGYVFKSLDNL